MNSTKTLAIAGVLSFSTTTFTTGCAGRAPGAVEQPDPTPEVDLFCASRPALSFFCEDFDVAALPGSFDDVVANNGTVDADGDGNSSPHSLHTVVEAVDGAEANVVASFEPGIKHRIFLQMKFDEDTADIEGGAEFVGIDFASETAPTWRVGYRVDDGEFSVFTQSGDDEPTLFPTGTTIEPEVWTSVRLDVFFNDELSPPGRCLGVGNFVYGKFRDDEVINCEPVTPPDTSASPTFVMGLRGTGGAVGTRYDNATFEVHTE